MPTRNAKNTPLMHKLSEVSHLIPTQDVAACLKAISEARSEEARTRVEMEKVRASRDVALAAIVAKHDLYRRVFDYIFEERRDAIQKHFEIIDRGIASDNQELILGGLRGLGQIVASSPFTDLKALSEVLEGDKPIEI